jgi:hypothetical protein
MAEERQELQGILLKYLSENKDENGRNTFNHIQRLLAHISFNKLAGGLDKFEDVSYELRTKGHIEVPERFFNYQALSLLAKPSLQSLYQHYYEVPYLLNH